MSTVTVPKPQKRTRREEIEKEAVNKYKKGDMFYGFPKVYWLGGGLVVSLLLCFYLATKLYGRNDNKMHNNTQPQTEVPQLTQQSPPMPEGGEHYQPQSELPVTQHQPLTVPSQAISSNAERLYRSDVLNRIPVSDQHLMQFESRYSQTPNIPQPKLQPTTAPQPKKQEELGTGSGQFEADTRTKEYYPSNKEGGGEGVPLPPINYEQLSQQYDDAF